MKIIMSKSASPNKKYDALIDGKQTLSFGAKGYSDYTINKDPARRLYIIRHSNED